MGRETTERGKSTRQRRTHSRKRARAAVSQLVGDPKLTVRSSMQPACVGGGGARSAIVGVQPTSLPCLHADQPTNGRLVGSSSKASAAAAQAAATATKWGAIRPPSVRRFHNLPRSDGRSVDGEGEGERGREG